MKRTEIERLLPGVFQRALAESSPLGAVLDTMETLHEPAEDVLRGLPEVFDPHRADERELTMLAHWVDLARIYPPQQGADTGPDWRARPAPIAPGRLRELIASAASLSQWRGSAHGLQRFLEIATGLRPFRLEEQVAGEDGEPIPFHLRIVAPQGAASFRELIERIVELEKPAYVTWELNIS